MVITCFAQHVAPLTMGQAGQGPHFGGQQMALVKDV